MTWDPIGMEWIGEGVFALASWGFFFDQDGDLKKE